MTTSTYLSVRDLEKFFFEAALATYAGQNAKKGTLTEIPGTKTYRYPEEGDRVGLVYYDTYWTNGEYSGGVTIIQDNGTTVWQMNYQGWCKDDNREVLTFLKQALTTAYQRHQFIGGRGPAMLLGPTLPQDADRGFPLMYENRPESSSSFEFFSGRERIYRYNREDQELFWHRYSGMLFRTVAPAIQSWTQPGAVR